MHSRIPHHRCALSLFQIQSRPHKLESLLTVPTRCSWATCANQLFMIHVFDTAVNPGPSLLRNNWAFQPWYSHLIPISLFTCGKTGFWSIPVALSQLVCVAVGRCWYFNIFLNNEWIKLNTFSIGTTFLFETFFRKQVSAQLVDLVIISPFRLVSQCGSSFNVCVGAAVCTWLYEWLVGWTTSRLITLFTKSAYHPI